MTPKAVPEWLRAAIPTATANAKALEFPSSNPWEVLEAIADKEQEIGKRVECIAIDEGQFVTDLFLFTKHLLDNNHDVLVAGLDLDFRAMPFGEMLNLNWLVNAYGGNITECIAYCTCGAAGALLAAAYRRQTRALRQPDQGARRRLRATLRRALCAAGQAALKDGFQLSAISYQFSALSSQLSAFGEAERGACLTTVSAKLQKS